MAPIEPSITISPKRNMIYIASGWWRDGHKEALERLERYLSLKGYNFFSPRLEGECPPNASKELRSTIFVRNLIAIRNSILVFARIDEYDPGTIWEMGYAWGRAGQTVAWSLVEGRGLNLMLAESCGGFVNGWAQIERFLPGDGKFKWEEARQWKQEVQ